MTITNDMMLRATKAIFYKITCIVFAIGYQIDENLFNIARIFPNLKILDMSNAVITCHSLKNKLNNMKKLEEVKFPSECPLLWELDGTFQGCECLQKVDLGHMPNLVSMNHTFVDCKSLKTVLATGVFESLAEMRGTFCDCARYSPDTLPFIAPNLEVINCAFMGTAVTSFEFKPMIVDGERAEYRFISMAFAFADCGLLERLVFNDLDVSLLSCEGIENLVRGAINFKIIKINGEDSWGPNVNECLMTNVSAIPTGMALPKAPSKYLVSFLWILRGHPLREGKRPELWFN